VVYSKKTDGAPGTDGVSLNLTASPVLFTKEGTTYDPGSTSTLSLSAFGGTITGVTWSTSAGTLTATPSVAETAGKTLTFADDQTISNINDSAIVSAAVTGTTSDGTTGVSFGTITAKISTSIQGADGATPSNGDPGLKTIQGYLYYEKNSANAPADPSGTTYTFSTGLVSGGSGATEVVAPASTAINKWTNSPRTQDPTSSNDHYTIRYFGTQNSATSDEASVTYSDAVPYTNFDGVVTFSNGTFSSGATALNDITSNTTSIDGGNIRTGTIKAAQLEISNLDADPASGSTDDGIFLDGTSNTIKIFAGGALRVKIGNLS
jgi:hypothetical protein